MARFDIIVGSVLGASEYVADALADTLKDHSHSSLIHLVPNYADIAKDSIWLICTSTHGAGDLPDNIQHFATQVSEQTLKGISFLVVGLGDSSYDTFCNGAYTLEQTLIQAGAKLLIPALHIDVLTHPIPEEVAVEWLNKMLPSLALS